MKELVTQAQAEVVLRIIAIAAPVFGVLAGAIVGLARKRTADGLKSGLMFGLSGTAVFGLWRAYTWSGHRYGYTSVSGIAIQFAVFLALGIGAGILIQTRFGSPNRLGRRCERSISTQEEKLNAS